MTARIAPFSSLLNIPKKEGAEVINEKDYLSRYRMIEQITHVFGTTLLTLLPVFFARLVRNTVHLRCFE
jgi:hypothetical protein